MPKEEELLFELRMYRTLPGQRENWVRYMEDVIIPFQVAKGMVILASFVGEEEDDLYVWIRRFADEEERRRLYEAVYQSDEWRAEIGPKIPTMMDREKMRVIRLAPTAKSGLH
jgi:hypothetical protein